MDQETLKTLSQFKILLKKVKGTQVDLEKLLRDAAYGREILAVAEDSENEALVLLALTIRDKFGHLVVAPAPQGKEEKKDDTPPSKYLHGARS